MKGCERWNQPRAHGQGGPSTSSSAERGQMTQRSIANISRRVGVALVVVATLSARRAPMPQFTRLLALDPDEGVFAYARISPDGKTLVYASEARNQTPGRSQTQIVTLVDLATQR